MHKKYIFLVLILILGIVIFLKKNSINLKSVKVVNTQTQKQILDPLTIAVMRERSYSGSDLKIEQTLEDGKIISKEIRGVV